MRYRELLEVYSEDNTYLLRHLKNDVFDAGSHWWAVSNIIMKNDKFRRAMEKVLKVKRIGYADQIEDQDPEIFYQLPTYIQKEIGEQTKEWLIKYDPSDAPTSTHLTVQKNQPLHRLTWLVHFTDKPDNIATKGFTIGMSDPDKLGLTTYFHSDSFDKAHGGYNFAFIADSKDAKNASTGHGYQPKYGNHAVMFQNSGIHVYHYADEENQIIFWGPDVKPRDIVVLHNNSGDWEVMARTFYYKDKTPSFDKVLYKGGKEGSNFEQCVDWVMNNFQQYRKALTGF